MSFIREFLTKYTFEVNDKPIERMKSQLASVGGKLRTAFNRDPIDRLTGKTITAEKAWGKISDRFSEVGEKVKQLGISFAAVGAAVGGVFLLTRSTAELGNELAKASQKLGLTVEQLQKFRYAADLSDVSAGDLDTSLRFLAKNMESASDGPGEQAKTFKAMGVAVRNADGSLRDTGSTLLDVAEKFSAMEDGPLKTARAMQIFGRSGTAMIPFLNEGRAGLEALGMEAEAFGVILSGDAAAASEEFLDTITRLQYILKGVKNVLGSALIPVFQAFGDELRGLLTQNRELMKQKVEQWARGIGVALKAVWNIAKTGFSILDRMARMMGGWERVIKLTTAALFVLGAGKVLAILGGLTKALWLVGAEFKAMGIKALIAQAQALAIPIAIGAAVAGIALLIEDVVTFFEGGESAFGKFLKAVQDNLDWMKTMFVDVGSTIIEFWLTPLRTVIEYLNKIVKTFTGFDSLNAMGILHGEAGEKQRKKLLSAGLGGAFDFVTNPIKKAKIDEKGILQTPEKQVGTIRAVGPNQPAIKPESPPRSDARATARPPAPLPALPEIQVKPLPLPQIQPSVAPRPEVQRAAAVAQAGAPVSLNNTVNVQASGMSPEAAEAMVAGAISKSQKDLLKRAGKHSQPKHKE